MAQQLNSKGIDTKVISMGEPDWKNEYLTPQFHTYVRLAGKNIDFIGFNMVGENTTGNRAKARAKTGYYNIEFHYIVTKYRMDDPKAYKAKLKDITRGMFSKEVLGMQWKGNELSGLLANDATTTERFRSLLKPYESIEIKPDGMRKCIHIILKTRLSVEYMIPNQTSDSELPSMQLYDVIERIAERVKRFAS
jgi:hypothetical protein